VARDPDALRTLLDETHRQLVTAGQIDAAATLRSVLDTAYTTAGEWLGELGVTIRRLRGEHDLPRAIAQNLDRALEEVRRAWPRL
jgi:hypothetical protein